MCSASIQDVALRDIPIVVSATVVLCVTVIRSMSVHTTSYTAECEDGDIKLLGGASEVEGRLEMCFNKRWTTIDGDGWTHTDTEVACRELGFSTSGIERDNR